MVPAESFFISSYMAVWIRLYQCLNSFSSVKSILRFTLVFSISWPSFANICSYAVIKLMSSLSCWSVKLRLVFYLIKDWGSWCWSSIVTGRIARITALGGIVIVLVVTFAIFKFSISFCCHGIGILLIRVLSLDLSNKVAAVIGVLWQVLFCIRYFFSM